LDFTRGGKNRRSRGGRWGDTNGQGDGWELKYSRKCMAYPQSVNLKRNSRSEEFRNRKRLGKKHGGCIKGWKK